MATIKKAIIILGPSGIGKSSVSSLICKYNNYKHCDADEFKWLFSHERSKKRTEIGEYLGYIYATKLIKEGYNIVIEAIPNKYMKKLYVLLKKYKYKTTKIVLKAPLEQCIRNNAMRKRKGYDKSVICEVYDKLSSAKGEIVDVTNMSVKQIYATIKKRFI